MERYRPVEAGNFIIHQQGEGSRIAGSVPRDVENLSQERRPLAGGGGLLFRIDGLRDDLATGVDDGIDLDKSICREAGESRYAIPFINRTAVGKDCECLPRTV